MSEIGVPFQFGVSPPAEPCPSGPFMDWYAGELIALELSAKGLCLSSPFNLGFVQGVGKALALLNPRTQSSSGALFTPQQMGYDPEWEKLPEDYKGDLRCASWRVARDLQLDEDDLAARMLEALETRMREVEADTLRRDRAHRDYMQREALVEHQKRERVRA